MKKTYNFTTFNFRTINGEQFTIFCNGYENAKNWGHEGEAILPNGETVNAKIVYYNRTWERFTFESLLYKIIEKAFPGKQNENEREYMCAQIRDIAEQNAKNAKAWLAAFEASYNNLSEKAKDLIADATDGRTVSSTDEVDALLMVGAAYDAIMAR